MYVSFEVVIIGYYMAQTRTKIFFYEKMADLDTVFIVENINKFFPNSKKNIKYDKTMRLNTEFRRKTLCVMTLFVVKNGNKAFVGKR